MGERRTSSKTESGLVELNGDTLDVSGTAILRSPLQVNTVNSSLVTATTAQIGNVFTSGKVEALGDITAKNFFTYSDGTPASGNIEAKNIMATTLLSCSAFDCSNTAAARNFIGGANGGHKLRLSIDTSGISRIGTQETSTEDTSRINLFGSANSTSPGIIQYSTKTGQPHVFEGGLVTSQAGFTMPSTGFAYLGRYVQRGFYGGGSVRPVILFPVPFNATNPFTQISVVCSPIRGNANIPVNENRMLYSVAVNNVTNLGFWASKSFFNTITNSGGEDVDSGFYWIATAGGLDT